MSEIAGAIKEQPKFADIELMIAAEDDSKTRAILMVLNNINNSMIANTAMTSSVASKLDAHLTKYELFVAKESDLVSRGIGAWRVAVWILGIAQLAVCAAVMHVNSGFAAHDARLIKLEVRDEQMAGQINENSNQVKQLMLVP